MHEHSDGQVDNASGPIPRLRLQVLRTGTYLHTYCSGCGANLVQDDWIIFNIKVGDQNGQLKLSPRFNVFDKESTIEFKPETELDDMVCPRCNESLINPRVTCERCNSKTASIKVSAVELDLHLNVCTRLGCPWHGLSNRDKARLTLDD
jgi:hypothetical protein